jgi:hypothetical protein
VSAGPDVEALRLEVAAGHGLGEAAAGFLTGSTVEELEAQAGALARVVGAADARREPEPAAAPGDPLADALAGKEQRQRELAALFTRRAPQPRDETGRYAGRGSFDGGARPSLPLPPPTHGEWLGQVLRTRSADRGASF